MVVRRGGRLTLGIGPSHHWIVTGMLGLPYQRPAAYTRDYLEVLHAAFSTPGAVHVTNDTFTVHNPLGLAPVAKLPVLIAALGPVMLALAGERADGTVLWMADERSISTHVVPRITKAAEAAGRPAPRVVAGIPVCLCRPADVPAARERANRILGEAEISPNYQRMLEHGDAGFGTMAERTSRRAEVLAVVTKALATDTAESWETRLRRPS
jgi:F420-dependent oxidoreductase-like protein